MKKRFLSMLLTLTLVLSAGNIVAAQVPSEQVDTPEQVITEVMVPALDTPFVDGDVPAESGALDGIIFPIHALTTCMFERGIPYNDADNACFWSGLYYMLGFYGQMDCRAELTDDLLILPPEAVADYAAALYASYSGLPELPANFADRITLQADGQFAIARGDASHVETRIDNTTVQSDGTILLNVSLVSPVKNDVLAQFAVTVAANNSMFGHAIVDAMII